MCTETMCVHVLCVVCVQEAEAGESAHTGTLSLPVCFCADYRSCLALLNHWTPLSTSPGVLSAEDPVSIASWRSILVSIPVPGLQGAAPILLSCPVTRKPATPQKRQWQEPACSPTLALSAWQSFQNTVPH